MEKAAQGGGGAPSLEVSREPLDMALRALGSVPVGVLSQRLGFRNLEIFPKPKDPVIQCLFIVSAITRRVEVSMNHTGGSCGLFCPLFPLSITEGQPIKPTLTLTVILVFLQHTVVLIT